MEWINNLADLPQKIINIVQLIIDSFTECASALQDFYTTLSELKDLILNMVVDPSAGSGLPVIEAIGLVRFLVGDVIFHILYLMIMIGCLATLYKLACLLKEAWHSLKAQINAGSYSGNALAELVSKFIS